MPESLYAVLAVVGLVVLAALSVALATQLRAVRALPEQLDALFDQKHRSMLVELRDENKAG
jgi:hypothetical protein